MIALICSYFIGKNFYRLAKDYSYNPWVFTTLGLISFYIGGSILGGIIWFFFIGGSMFNGVDILFAFPGLGLMHLPFGIGVAVAFHYILERSWKKSEIWSDDDIDDIGKLS